ncbi:hypothetical protein CVIRNUC_011151 [Coccomyxa viridis]|uniref:Uncharacterized protein n=1 Tax=Coccomyxa viridis TaxID=1274662 RepID=A0AAV1ILD1_9CHLO|nr:hypothetical protein CVIRNUC_011151 [Coccomyxa viridis]
MPPAASPAASAAPSGLEAKIKKLEQQLSVVTAERNDLAADVEALCMQSSGDIFSASSVLGDRICHIQKEANRLQSQLDAVTAERNSLHEDLISHRDSKRTVDRQWRLERERCERLESELAFYQSHSAQALSDRDKAVWEAEELKGQLLKAEGDLRDARAALSAETDSRAEAERQLSQVRQQNDSLRAKAKASEEIPALRRHLSAARTTTEQLEQHRDSLQDELSSTQKSLAEAQEALWLSKEEAASIGKEAASAEAASEELVERLNTDNARLEAEVTRLRRERSELEDRAEEAEGGLAAAQADMETGRKALQRELADERTEARRAAEEAKLKHSSQVTALQTELDALKKEHKEQESELSKAVEERNSALVRIAAAEDTATQAFEEVGNMRDEVADLKERLVKATQEKVAALMQAADAKGNRRTSAGGGKGSSASPAKTAAQGGGWRVWGSHSGDGALSAVTKSGSDKEEAERPQNGKTES